MDTNATVTPDIIKFGDFHLPALTDGLYKVTQTISSNNDDHKFSDSEKDSVKTRYFYVAGERYVLSPNLIGACYPPSAGSGVFDNVLPHVELKRSTLPWERYSGGPSDTTTKPETPTPWLALILLDESEFASGGDAKFETITWADYKSKIELEEEPGDKDPTEEGKGSPDLKCIWINNKLAEQIMPSAQELRWLTHVCISKDGQGKEYETAKLICGRLPRPGARCSMHLVSLEGRYNDAGVLATGVNDAGYLPLLSLHSWEFTCLNASGNHGTFKHFSDQLNANTFSFDSESKSMPVVAQKYTALGSVPMPHTIRTGQKTLSWYHGPLVSSTIQQEEFDFPVLCSDELLLADIETTGMLDVSYAAAWELGRLMTLSDTTIATKIQTWKLSHALEVAHSEQALLHSHLPFHKRDFDSHEDSALSDSISNYFAGLHLLKGIPFSYLLPDDSMLPMESIRFFQIDPLWCMALADGAFSIGRTSKSDVLREKDKMESESGLPNAAKYATMSGVLIRSELVSGWPGLEIDAYDSVINSDKTYPEKVLLYTIDTDVKKLTEELNKQNLPVGIRNLINDKMTISNRPKDTHFKTESLSNDLSIEEHYKDTWQLCDNLNHEYFLIQAKRDKNSKLVSLQVFDENKIPLLRKERLSPNVLLCLFEGIAQTVDLHLPEQALHFGVMPFDENTKVYKKEIKSLKTVVSVEMNGERKVDIVKLVAAMTSKIVNSGQLGYELIEGVPRVRFFNK